MPARPLKAISYDHPTLVEQNGKVVAIVAPNLDGNYGYKLNTFRAQFRSITGAKDSDGNLFVIGNFANAGGGEAFDITLGYKDGKKVEDKKLIEDLDKRWTMDLMPIICHANGVHSFEILAEVANELSIILVDQNIDTQQFMLVNIDDKDSVKGKLSELCVLWISAYEENPDKPYEHKEKGSKILELGEELGNYGLFYVPLCDGKNDPRLDQVTVQAGGTRFKPEIKLALPSIKGDALCPYESLEITLPTIKKKGSWSGSKSETTAEALKARETYLLEKFKANGCESIDDVYRAVTPEKSRGSESYFDFLIKVMG